jgi:hypothetical protein
MARWGKCDFRELEQLNKRLEQLSSVDFDAFCREAANEIAARLLEKVKKRTPVGVAPKFDEPLTTKVRGNDYITQVTTKTGEKMFRKRKGKSYTMLTRSGAIRDKYWSGYEGGTLRDAWTILPVEKQGDQYIVTVVNNTEYASYVEYGHRQTPGRYVPALGKSLKASWVKGRFMLTISTQELETQAPALLQQKLYLFLKEVF